MSPESLEFTSQTMDFAVRMARNNYYISPVYDDRNRTIGWKLNIQINGRAMHTVETFPFLNQLVEYVLQD